MYEICGGLALLPEGIGKDVSIAVEKNRIADIGKTSEMRKKHEFSDSVGSKDTILCPGFIDTHMHSFQIATRGLTSDKGLLDWLKRYIWKWEGMMTKEQAGACAKLAYLESLRSGTTTIVDYTSVRHTDEAFRAAEELGIRAFIGKTMMDRNSPAELQESTEKSVKDTELLIRKWDGKEKGRLRYSITPRFGMTCTDELLKECRRLAAKYGVLLTTHAHESKFEIEADRKNYGESAIEHFNGLGLLGKRTLLAHCVWLTEKELRLLAQTGTKVAHCPGSNMMLASGCAQIGKMQAAGISIGLGSDMGAYYRMGIPDQMRLSVLLQKVTRLNPTELDHRTAFGMATEGGAKALGINCGMLKKGKLADVALFSGKNISMAPKNDVIAQLVYCIGSGAVESVICDGRILIRDGKLLAESEKKIIEKAQEILGFRT